MAKIDTSKITGYAEMSAEDKLKALEAFEYEDNAAELDKQKAAVSKVLLSSLFSGMPVRFCIWSLLRNR